MRKPLVDLRATLQSNRNRIALREAELEDCIVLGQARCHRCGGTRAEHTADVGHSFICHEQRELETCQRALDLLRQLGECNK